MRVNCSSLGLVHFSLAYLGPGMVLLCLVRIIDIFAFFVIIWNCVHSTRVMFYVCLNFSHKTTSFPHQTELSWTMCGERCAALNFCCWCRL